MPINLSGILFRVWGYGAIMVSLGLIILFIGEKKYRATAVMVIVFYLLYIGCHLWIYLNPKITVFDGKFVSSKWHRRVAPHTKAYQFESVGDQRQRLYLDSHTKRTLFPFELRADSIYRIYYETRTNIIVGIETLQE